MSVFKRGEIHGTSSAMARTDSRVATAGVAAVKPRSDQIDVLWQDFINALQDAVRVFNEKHLANVSKDFQVNCNSEDPEKSFSLLGIAFINIQTASSWSGAGL